MTHFDTAFISPSEALPSVEQVSAVFLIALKGDEIVVIRNHRGWDIPAGHVEKGETIHEALIREVREEASMDFGRATQFVKIVSDDKEGQYVGKCMIGFMTDTFQFNEFVPAPDSEERRLMRVDAFLSLYQGAKENMELMIRKAQSHLGAK